MAGRVYHTPKVSLAKLAQSGLSQTDLATLAALDAGPHDHYLDLNEIAAAMIALPHKKVLGQLFMRVNAARIFADLHPSTQVEVLKRVDSPTQTRLLNSVGINDLAFIVNALSLEDRNGRFGALLLLGLSAAHPDIASRLQSNPFLRGWRYLQVVQDQERHLEADLRSKHLHISYQPSENTVQSGTLSTEITEHYHLVFSHPSDGGIVLMQLGAKKFLPSIIGTPIPQAHGQIADAGPTPTMLKRRHDIEEELETLSAAITKRCSPDLFNSQPTKHLRVLAQAKIGLGGAQMIQDAKLIYQEILRRDPTDTNAQNALDQLNCSNEH